MNSPAQCQNSFQLALQVQNRAADVGFDWPDVWPVLDKANEEIEEIRHALESKDTADAVEELGDLLFTAVNIARFLQADPDAALIECVERFEERFSRVQEEVVQSERTMSECSLDELDEIWERIKKA